MPEIILYVDKNFGGLHTHQFFSLQDFTQILTLGVGVIQAGDLQVATWNDLVSSFVIVNGVWQFFKDINWQTPYGAGVQLGPGLYPWVEDVGIDNDSLSSILLVG